MRLVSIVLSLVLLSSPLRGDPLDSGIPPAKSPVESLQSIHVRPGFRVELAASEPLLRDPIAFAWGADRKLWVVEMGDYPQGLDGKGKPGGRIKFLEDTNGDGKYVRSTLFLDGLSFPTGIMPWRKGVLVICPPEIFYAEDTDGDGRADLRTTLFSGFTRGNPQHRANGLVWGLDNWIYGANGDSGGAILSVKTGKKVNVRGRDFRFRPDDGAFETQTGQTQFGRARDDWNNWFGCNNIEPMYHFVLEDHYLRRNPHLAMPTPRWQVSVTPGSAPVYPASRTLPRFNDFWTANHFTSACGVIVYRDNLFGADFADNSFVSEPVHNLVHREVMKPKGVTFSSQRAPGEEKTEFLAAADNWFRPTSLQTGPDGALWIADMYRAVIEHPEWIPKAWQKRLDLRTGDDKGRIYRVFPELSAPRRIPRLDRWTITELVSALDSPSGWQRDTAQQLLIQRADPAAHPCLEKLAHASKNPLARVHALYTLDALGSLSTPLLRESLADPHPGVRRHAIRLCETRLRRDSDLGPALLGLVKDGDLLVQLQLVYTLGEWDDPRAGQTLGELALRYANDRYLTAAVLSSLHSKNLQTVLSTVLAASQKAALPAKLTENLLIMAKALANSQALAALLHDVAHPRDGRYFVREFAVVAALLDTLERRDSSLLLLKKEGSLETKAAVDNLAPLFDAARSRALNSQAAPEERQQAIRLLGRGLDHREQDVTALSGMLTPHVSENIQAAALQGLGRVRDVRALDMVLDKWHGLSPGLRSQALELLLEREDGVKALIRGLETKKVFPREIDAARRQRLLSACKDQDRDGISKLFGEAINRDRQKVVDHFRSALPGGEAPRGVQVFARTCATCHRIGNVGQAVGPDLASLKDKSTDALLVAIFDPNRAVESRFLNYIATTHNGLTITGVLTSETGNSVTLVGPDGKEKVILRNDLEELASTGKSAMPEGLEKDLKPQDVADLITFLQFGSVNPPRSP